MRRNEYEDWEIALIRAMKADGQWTDQAIQAWFTRPDRNFSTGRLSRNDWPQLEAGIAPAAPQDMRRFVDQARMFGRDQTLRLHAGGRPVLQVEYRFMPVGQGLFSTGRLFADGLPAFHWVYDCGTLSRQVNIGAVIARCDSLPKAPLGEKPWLDILVLSHFHEDHFSGMVDLLARYRVRWLLLPYLTPWQRLDLLLAWGGAAASPYARFLRDPVAFIREAGEVETILLVPPGGEAAPPAGPGADTGGGGPDRDRAPPKAPGQWWIAPPATTLPSAHEQLADPALSSGGTLLMPGTALTLSAVWEFLPYCDDTLSAPFDSAFRQVAHSLAATFLARGDQPSLDALRAEYDKRTTTAAGKPSHRLQNAISLHLYAGPVGEIEAGDLHVEALTRAHAPAGSFRLAGPDLSRIGQLLTGDAMLTARAFARVAGVLGPHGRLDRAGVFQVPHHGSSRNWTVGQAAVLAPRLSVFSSDDRGFRVPRPRGGHPHPAVWADFRPFAPVRANLQSGWRVEAAFAL